MSKKEKSICTIEFLGKKADWKSWSEKFLSCGKQKGYMMLLVISGSTSGMDKIPTQDKNKNALEGDIDLNKKIIKFGELNELAHEDLILLINTSFSAGKMAFGLVRNAKSTDFSEGSCKIVWGRLVSKYAPNTASSLLKLKIKFHNSKLEWIKKDPDKWILNLEELIIWLNEFSLNGSITDEDFMIHVLNNLPKENDEVLDGLENCLMASGYNVLPIDIIWEKLNHWYEKTKGRNEEKKQKKKRP